MFQHKNYVTILAGSDENETRVNIVCFTMEVTEGVQVIHVLRRCEGNTQYVTKVIINVHVYQTMDEKIQRIIFDVIGSLIRLLRALVSSDKLSL